MAVQDPREISRQKGLGENYVGNTRNGEKKTTVEDKKTGEKKWTTKILADELGLTMRFNAVFADKTDQTLKQVAQKFGTPAFLEEESF